jgi:hypothetical protein
MSTRDAFAAVNAMFTGNLAAEHGGAGALPPTSGLAEPTVTISTKAAFEALNAMFAGGGSGVQATTTQQPKQQQQQEELNMREDTVFLAVPNQQQQQEEEEESTAGFSIREDTVFISMRPAGAAAMEDDATGGSLSIREDTVFINPPRAVAAEEPALREETVFFISPGAKGDDDGGLMIREDTIFINPGTLALADTQDATADLPQHAAGASRWGFPPGADDTLQLGVGMGALRLSAGGQAALGSSSDTSNELMEKDKENAGPLTAAPLPRAMESAQPLAPLGASRLDALGAVIEADPEAEAALAAAPEGGEKGDDFAVFCDEGDANHDSLPRMGSPTPLAVMADVVDPFGPGFQSAMLANLDPPVEQVRA